MVSFFTSNDNYLHSEEKFNLVFPLYEGIHIKILSLAKRFKAPHTRASNHHIGGSRFLHIKETYFFVLYTTLIMSVCSFYTTLAQYIYILIVKQETTS